MSTQPSELGRFHPVAENVVLAAVERAQRRESRRGEPVVLIRIAQHLGFTPGAYTTRCTRPLLGALVQAGALEHSRRFSRDHWALTSVGRRRLVGARRRGEQLALPEAPQHRAWYSLIPPAACVCFVRHRPHARGARPGCRATRRRASRLGNVAVMTRRLAVRAELLGSAIYSAREWAEPDDAERDVDDARPARGSPPQPLAPTRRRMSPAPRTPEEEDRAEAEQDDNVLALLFSSPYPWSLDELARELDDRFVADRVWRLAHAGLVHRLEGFVFPTRTARRVRELYEPY